MRCFYVRRVGFGGCSSESVDRAGDVSLETASGFAGGLAFGDSFGDVRRGCRARARTGEDDRVERSVESAVSVTVETVAPIQPGGSFDGRDAG